LPWVDSEFLAAWSDWAARELEAQLDSPALTSREAQADLEALSDYRAPALVLASIAAFAPGLHSFPPTARLRESLF